MSPSNNMQEAERFQDILDGVWADHTARDLSGVPDEEVVLTLTDDNIRVGREEFFAEQHAANVDTMIDLGQLAII